MSSMISDDVSGMMVSFETFVPSTAPYAEDYNTNPQVMMLSNNIKDTIDTSLNPLASQIDRQKAFQAQEEFKSSSPHCAEVGLYLFSVERKNSDAVRLCALKFVDHFIETKWNDLTYERKTFYKKQSLMLVEQMRYENETYLKEAAAQIVVEVIKRTWPQSWPDLFKDLADLQCKGDAQLELVLIILMRLSEDVNGLDERLTTQRKRDMMTAFQDNANDLFDFFIKTIRDKVTALKTESSSLLIRLSEATLFTMMEFVSWAHFDCLFNNEKIIFQILFWLLEVKYLRFYAAACLDNIFQRKGTPEKRIEFMVVLSDDVLNIVENVVKSLKKTNENVLPEEGYKFLKKLAEMLVSFGKIQILSLWGDERGFNEKPVGYDRYLRLMLLLFQHESMKLTYDVSKFWHALSIHPHGKLDDTFKELMPDLLDCAIMKIAKISDPKIPNNPSSHYSTIDFDDRENYSEYFANCRGHMTDVCRKITNISYTVVLDHCLLKIKLATSKPPPDVSAIPKNQISLTQHYLYWDALVHFLKNGFAGIFFRTNKEISEDTISKCNEIVSLLIHYKSEVPLFNIPIVNLVESMFPIFKYSSDHLLPTMQLLFSIIRLPQDDEHPMRDHLFKLKRHVCEAYAALCKEIPVCLVDYFKQLEEFAVYQMMHNNSLTGQEKCRLIEGVLRISKHVTVKEQQARCINSIFDMIDQMFEKEPIKRACESPVSLINYIGLDQPGTVAADSELRNRELLFAINLWTAACKALLLSKEDENIDDITEAQMKTQIESYPWIKRMVSMLPKLLNLLQSYSLIWQHQDKIIDKKVLVHKIITEINPTIQVFQAHNTEENKEKRNLGQYYLCTFYESAYTSLGQVSRSIGPSLFTINGLASAMNEKLVKNWVNLPNYRLGRITRTFIKDICLACPSRYFETFVAPFISAVLNLYFERISSEWARLEEAKENPKEATDKLEEQIEIAEERMVYLMSKDLLDLILSLLTFKRRHLRPATKPPDGSLETFGALGNFLLECEETNFTIVHILFTALTWPDTGAAIKVATIIQAVIKKIFTDTTKVDPEIPKQLLLLILRGLTIHGGDEFGKAALTNNVLQFYLHLRMQYRGIVQVMQMIPTCEEQHLREFDLAVFVQELPLTEQQQKKIFRRFVAGICGQAISKLHEKDVVIQDLPALLPRKKEKKMDINIDANTNEDLGLCSLFRV